MRRLHCQLPADVMVKLYYSLVYSHLTYALLAWGRLGLCFIKSILGEDRFPAAKV